MLYCLVFYFFFFKQKTAYEMRISDWSSDVCSSDLRLLSVSQQRHNGLQATSTKWATHQHAEPRHRQYAKPTLRDIVTPLFRIGANPPIRKSGFPPMCKTVNP